MTSMKVLKEEYTYSLAIDTATAETKVLLFARSDVCGERISAAKRADNLLLLIDQLLEEHCVRPTEIDAIFVRRGRGSYTGLRIGITTAAALAWAWQIPLLAIESQRRRPLLPSEWQRAYFASGPSAPSHRPDFRWPQLVPTYRPWPGKTGSGNLKRN